MRTRYGSRRILLCMQLCFICLALGLPGNSWGTLSSEVYFNEVSPEIDVTLQTSGGNISTHAGHYNVTVQNTYPENEFWEGSFDGFCVDVYQNAISDWKSYDLVEINADYQEAAWLLGNYSDYADAASAQLAVWEVVTETDTSFDLGTGTFTATAGGGAYVSNANSLLSQLPGQAFLNNYDYSGYMVAESGTYQDFIIHNPSAAPVPEPGTMFLLGSGLLGMIGIGRRRFVKNR